MFSPFLAIFVLAFAALTKAICGVNMVGIAKTDDNQWAALTAGCEVIAQGSTWDGSCSTVMVGMVPLSDDAYIDCLGESFSVTTHNDIEKKADHYSNCQPSTDTCPGTSWKLQYCCSYAGSDPDPATTPSAVSGYNLK